VVIVAVNKRLHMIFTSGPPLSSCSKLGNALGTGGLKRLLWYSQFVWQCVCVCVIALARGLCFNVFSNHHLTNAIQSNPSPALSPALPASSLCVDLPSVE
jgi:hypothetical protein